MTSETPNNFQYSYTKFLNDRKNMKESFSSPEMESNSKVSQSPSRLEWSATKEAYKVGTETELYGSLRSGKIYQTAVNEPISVAATADFTVIKFDGETKSKKIENKGRNHHAKKFGTAESEIRFSDLLQKIASLFQNDSHVSYPKTKHSVKDDRYIATNIKKPISSFKNRKLLSETKEEAINTKDIFRAKRNVQDTKVQTSHDPLIISPTVPYLPESSIHTTGVITSTTGTDIIDGRTTEWTTIVEGTYINGTYAHILQSTSRIFYTVNTVDASSSSTLPSFTKSSDVVHSKQYVSKKPIEISTTETITKNVKSLDVTQELTTRSQRINDKSVKDLDALIEMLSSSSLHEKMLIMPSLSETVLVETTGHQSHKISTSGISIPERLFPVLPDSNERNESRENHSFTISSTGDIFSSSISSVLVSNEMPIIVTPVMNDVVTTEEQIPTEDTLHLLNIVARMAASNNPGNKANSRNSSLIRDSVLISDTLPVVREGILRNPITETPISIHITPESVKTNISMKDTTISISPNLNKSIIEIPSKTLTTETDKNDKDEPTILHALSDDIFSKMKTSLRIPEITDLFPHFKSESSMNGVIASDIGNGLPNDLSSSITLTSLEDEFKLTTGISFSTDNLLMIAPTPSSSVSPSHTRSFISRDNDFHVVENFNIEDKIESNMMSPHGVKNNDSSVMLFLGVVSTLSENTERKVIDSSRPPAQNENIFPSTEIDNSNALKTLDANGLEEKLTAVSFTDEKKKNVETSMPDITVLLVPSMKIEELKMFIDSSKSSTSSSLTNQNAPQLENDSSLSGSSKATPVLEESLLENTHQRVKRSPDTVTVLGPEGRIISTDARVYLTPTTHYTTYTYYTTILKPNGGTQVQSSLHVDSVVILPNERSVYGQEDQHCCDGVRHTAIDGYETRYAGRPIGDSHYHVETIPYDIERASEITHRTTYTYYTTKFRGGTSFVETRKETETNVTPIPSVRYSPFEIGTHYDGYYPDDLHYQTEPPRIAATRPHDHIHKTTYTYYTTRYIDGTPYVETRRQTDRNVTPIPTYHRPNQRSTQVVRTHNPTYTQRIDPNLYKPDRVTHRTTYTYHTTRFRDGTPIVNTRKETETNVTPIPTYYRPENTYPHTANRDYPSAQRSVIRTVPYDTYRPQTDPYETHRTTYTYYTTKLRGGNMHVDTRYVTETNITPHPTIPYVRGSTYAQPHYDDEYYENECPICREAQRASALRYSPNSRIRGRTNDETIRRAEMPFDEVTPSTATHYSTFTYATTLLEGGRPVVNTREHTVTEVLSDVVLPSLKFGDRIRSKRTVKPEVGEIITTGVDSLKSSARMLLPYSDGRQQRRIAVNDQNRQNINKFNVNLHSETHSKKPHSDTEIKPSSITYYSTYTYFTTELNDGRPTIKTREHTVTEILTDVIVPTVVALRRPHTDIYATSIVRNARNRRVRRTKLYLDEENVPRRKLLYFPGDLSNLEESKEIIFATPTLPLKMLAISNVNDELIIDNRNISAIDFVNLNHTVFHMNVSNLPFEFENNSLTNENQFTVGETNSTEFSTNSESEEAVTSKNNPDFIINVSTKEIISNSTEPSIALPKATNAISSKALEEVSSVEKDFNITLVTSETEENISDAGSNSTKNVNSNGNSDENVLLNERIYPWNNTRIDEITSGSDIKVTNLNSVAERSIKRNDTKTKSHAEVLDAETAIKHTATIIPTPILHNIEKDFNTALMTSETAENISDAGSNSSENVYSNGNSDENVSLNERKNLWNNTRSDEVLSGSDMKVTNPSSLAKSIERNVTKKKSHVVTLDSETATKHAATILPTLSLHSNHLNILNSFRAEIYSSKVVLSPSTFKTESNTVHTTEPSFLIITDDKTDELNFKETLSLPKSIQVWDETTSTPKLNSKYLDEDLDAQGAEARHAIVSTPTTHYTTYTYYTTVLKPGGRRVTETNTKVVSTTYYQQVPNTKSYLHDTGLDKGRIHNMPYNEYRTRPTSKCCDYLKPSIRATRRHDLAPQYDVTRTRAAYTDLYMAQPYRPSFATTIRGPQHLPNAAQDVRSRKCHSCLKEQPNIPSGRGNVYEKLPYNHSPVRHKESHITSVPVHRMFGYQRRIPDRKPNTIPYAPSDIKPTHVTYYSTYTYFTTELQDGSPVVRSREHTVTEILTDVIVPTVTSVSHQSSARYLQNRRGKRDINDNYLDINNQQSPVPQRCLLGLMEYEKVDKDDVNKDENESILQSLFLNLSFMMSSPNTRNHVKTKSSSTENDSQQQTKTSTAQMEFSGDIVTPNTLADVKGFYPTPVTHFRTYTHFKTVVKPDKAIQVQTSTHVYSVINNLSSTASNVRNREKIPRHQIDRDTLKLPISNKATESSRFNKPYYINPKRSEDSVHKNHYQKNSHSINTNLFSEPIVYHNRKLFSFSLENDDSEPSNVLKSLSEAVDSESILSSSSAILGVRSNEEMLIENRLNSQNIYPSSLTFLNFNTDGDHDFLDTTSYLLSSKLPPMVSLESLKSQNISSNVILESSEKPKTYQRTTAVVSVSPLSSMIEKKNMISVISSSFKKNGRMTKYTTTIYGTYINGVYAQRAKSRSDIVPITDMHLTKVVTTQMFSPSRMPGLVRSIVSRKVRGPVAVHLTTEIHGTFVGGAYAQTARVFTSSQPLSSTRESLRMRITSHTIPTVTGTRKTGLLSSRVLRSKVDGTKTLLFVSEIYGTHIGGAYAHLGTYTTRTIVETTSTTNTPEITSQKLPTFYMEDLTTGLVTASVTDKILNGTTTRYHYEVYGTYLDGTYAHVPSISTETFFSTSPLTTSQILNSKDSNAPNKSASTAKLDSSYLLNNTNSFKIGLIEASTRAHVNNGTTTKHIFAVYGTYLDGIYAHVPSILVETITPTIMPSLLETEQMIPDYQDKGGKYPDFEILTIFTESTKENSTTDFLKQRDEKTVQDETQNSLKLTKVSGMEVLETLSYKSSDINENIIRATPVAFVDEDLRESAYISPQVLFRPILLPEALRISFAHESRNHRIKRYDPFSPYLRSSFTESVRSQKENHPITLTATAPLPATIYEGLSPDSTKKTNSQKLKQKTALIKPSQNQSYKSEKVTHTDNVKSKLKSSKRSKRSPFPPRSSFGSSKRFGSTSSSSRKFGTSNTFKKDFSSSTNGFRIGSSTEKPSLTVASKSSYSRPSKRLPNFLSNQRPKPSLRVSTSSITASIKPSTSNIIMSSSRRFGKKELDDDLKIDDDFEASEAIPQEITEETFKASTSRFRRPSKFPNLNIRSTSLVTPSKTRPTKSYSMKQTFPTRRSRTNKNIPTRNRKTTLSSYEEHLPTTLTSESSSKKRFTRTTTFSINVKPTAGYLTSIDDTEDGNNLQDYNSKEKSRSRAKSSGLSTRNRSSYKPTFDNDDNEVGPEKPKTLPLPVFGRSRGFKRPPKFDPRTIKASTSGHSSTIHTFVSGHTESDFNTSDTSSPIINTGPVTVTDVFTTVKTLPVHLGLRTSFATITTTAYATSTIQPEDLTTITLGGITKTLFTAFTGLPDANLPKDKQFTVVTEVILTSTEIFSSSVVAIKVGFGTRTDTIIAKQILTTLTTQTNTIFDQQSSIYPLQQQYPYFPNPFAPQMPFQNPEFSLSLAENSFISTQTVVSTTVLPLFFNGKTVFTTISSTSLSESTVIKTTTVKVPQPPSALPFIFPQPVFILPSITTEITLQFTAQNGEIHSFVTLITVPLALNGHTRLARSAQETSIKPTVTFESSAFTKSFKNELYDTANNEYGTHSINDKFANDIHNLALQTSFDFPNVGSQVLTYKESTEKLNVPLTLKTNRIHNPLSSGHPSSNQTDIMKAKLKLSKRKKFMTDKNDFISEPSFRARKLLQINEEESVDPSLMPFKFNDKISSNEKFPLYAITDSTQSGSHIPTDDGTYLFDSFHLLGSVFNDDSPGRPIPTVRVIPTRRAYVRRIKPDGPQNAPHDTLDDYNYRRNLQNFQRNPNLPRNQNFNPGRQVIRDDPNFGLGRNVPNFSNNRPFVSTDMPQNGFRQPGNAQFYGPNRQNYPPDLEETFEPSRGPPNFVINNRPNRLTEQPINNFNSPRNPTNFNSPRQNAPPRNDGYDAVRNLPNFTPRRQNAPPLRDEPINSPINNNNDDSLRNQLTRSEPQTTNAPRRVIRLRRPSSTQQSRPQSGRELLDRKPIINALPEDGVPPVRGRGPVVVTNTATVRDLRNPNAGLVRDPEGNGLDNNLHEVTEALPLTYYTTFTYMTTFLNGPSTAYSTREAVVSNIATETLNPRLVGLIRSRGGFANTRAPSAVPLGSRAQGATTTIVNLASRVQLYNSDVYYGRLNSMPGRSVPNMKDELNIKPTETALRTIPITDIASLPKTYYTLFTYYYTLKDGDKSSYSQRSETVSSVDKQTDPFLLQDFASTVDSSGFLTLKPNKQLVNLGLRTAGGTTTEVNLELKTVVHIDGLKNAIIDRGSIAPTLVEVVPSETRAVLNNYLEVEDAEVQDQQTYPQTVAIQPSFSSATEDFTGIQRSSSNREATPAIPSNNRAIRTEAVRGPLRVASTILQRPGALRSGVFAPRPGVRVRVRPASSRVESSDSLESDFMRPDVSPLMPHFDSTRGSQDSKAEEDDYEDEMDISEEDDDKSVEETEETDKSQPSGTENTGSSTGRRRLKITIRRSPGITASPTNSRFIRPTRTRPRFYVVTRTASSDLSSVRPSKRPVSVRVNKRPRPSEEPRYQTYTTMTSVPVVFGLSTTYRNALVTSSSLLSPDELPDQSSKTVVLTYFTTTTYTVPYTVDGRATFTTLEETNSRIATETLDPDADLSFVSTTTLDYGEETMTPDNLVSPVFDARRPTQTLRPQTVNNQLNVGPRMNLITKVSNGVTLIVATDGEIDPTQTVSQPTVTLRPTMVTDALLMLNKDVTTLYEPRTFYTTFTFFTTFFSDGTPSISTSEQVSTNVYTVPVTHTISANVPIVEPVTVVETSENLVSTTLYSTHTFYATLFNGTETIVTPLEELQSSVISSTETYTITKTIIPTPSATWPPEIRATERPGLVTTTSSIYKTVTNFVTLFRGSESIVSPLEEVETNIITLTLDNVYEQPSRMQDTYTTRTIQATNTHYITLFSGSDSILSSITEIAPSVITELIKQLQEPATTPFFSTASVRPTTTLSSPASVEPTFQDLVPSIRTQYTTLTYFTTLFTDSSTILSSREEVATSYITLFVPAPLPGATSAMTSGTFIPETSQKSETRETDKATVTPESEVLTFYTTYTYYTTLFRGTETIISDSETVVTQYVTIESTPTDIVSRQTTSLPSTFSRPITSDSFEIRIEPTTINLASNIASKLPSEIGEDYKIIGVSTKVESNEETPSILTGIPSTDSNGATHILFTDFIVPSSIDEAPAYSSDTSTKSTPSLPDIYSSYNLEPSSISFYETTYFPHETLTPSSARDSASDFATTRLTDVNVATHHMMLHPTTSYQSGASQTLGIKPGAVIDLSDVLTNTNLVGNLGETIKDIVNLFAANNNRIRNNGSQSDQSSNDQPVAPPSGGVTISNADEPVYIPIGAIGRTTKTISTQASSRPEGSMLRPSTIFTGFTPLLKDEEKNSMEGEKNRKLEPIKAQEDVISGTFTSIVFGSNTIFIQPSSTTIDTPTTILISEVDGRFHNSFNNGNLEGSVSSPATDQRQKATPGMSSETTSLVTGFETIFFGFPDARRPPQLTTQHIRGSISTSSIVGIETIFFDSPGDFFAPGSDQINISGATTIFGTYPAIISPSSSTERPQSSSTTSSSGETTIFFPVPGDNHQQINSPGTRYVTSVESVTLTLTLTTSSVYETSEMPVTVTSVFTTTIPPRTFVSTIIGSRTILGTQPEPTEAVQVIPTMQPSESTTTVTTTTLIFNSIATTVVRTLVIPTNAIQATKPSTSTATETVKIGGVISAPSQRPSGSSDKITSRKPIHLFKSGNRPTDPTTPKPIRTGPPLKLFPTKPPTTTTIKPPTTTRKSTPRKPGKTLTPITDGCPRECNLKNKEVCKQNPDKSWSCQCRPGFFKKDGSDECRDVKSYVVLVRVLKMGGNDVKYNSELNNYLSPEYKNLTTTARKAVDDAYKTSSVGDDYVSANVLSVSEGRGIKPEGVLVNLTVQLSGEKPSNEEFLKEELAQSLEASATDIDFANATLVSPIIQRVEDVQDFDECAEDNYNDCSRSAICVNLPGTYTCECKEGYQDLEPLLPGRICSGEIKDCDYCNNRGVCIMTEDDNKFCRCYRMYLGKQCEINGLVLAIALPIALALLILTMFCLLCGCRKLRQRRTQKPKPNVFKGMVPPMAGTLDRKAMIMDSSSESSGEHRPPPPVHGYDGFSEDVANSTMRRSRRESMDDQISADFQVPTVLIPRAKHSHPKQVNAPYPSYRMPPDMDRW